MSQDDNQVEIVLTYDKDSVSQTTLDLQLEQLQQNIAFSTGQKLALKVLSVGEGVIKLIIDDPNLSSYEEAQLDYQRAGKIIGGLIGGAAGSTTGTSFVLSVVGSMAGERLGQEAFEAKYGTGQEGHVNYLQATIDSKKSGITYIQSKEHANK